MKKLCEHVDLQWLLWLWSLSELFMVHISDIANSDRMIMGHCNHLNCTPVAKRLNYNHVTLGMLQRLQFQGPITSLLVQHCGNFEWRLTE